MRAATYRRQLAIFGLETTRARPPAQLVDPPSCFVVERRSSLKRHCPKLTVFRAAANSSVAFQSGSLGSAGASCGVSIKLCRQVSTAGKISCWVSVGPLGQAKFDPANARQYPHTVARKSAMRLRPRKYVLGDRAGQQQDHFPTESRSTLVNQT
jgi:hypothetical protein